MSTSDNQTRLSLRLRKRNQERSEDALPMKKKQSKSSAEDTQLKNDLPAFSPPIDEEKKITKRSTDLKPATTDNVQTKKQNTRQTNIKEILNSSMAPQPTDSDTTEVDSANTKPTITETTTDQHEALSTEKTGTHVTATATSSNVTEVTTKKSMEKSKIHITATTKMTELHDLLPSKKTQTDTTTSAITTDTNISTKAKTGYCTDERSFPATLQSPSQSPILGLSPPEKHNSSPDDSSQEMIDSDVLPSPMITPEATRIAKTNLVPASPFTTSENSVPKPPSATMIMHGKSLLSKLEKERIADERSTLDKLVSALDISLTFHAARNVAAFFHKLQPMLRNSTKKNITISHLRKILFVAPELYDVETKLLKEYGKEVEAHQVSIGHDWKMPLSGKMIEERKDLMTKRSGEYYENKKGSIPELELPSMDKVVDKKKWLEKAKLPDRVRSVLELQEKRKLAMEEKASQPRIEPKGTAKDRAKALLDRIRNKQKK